jgi:hypothetical protein
LYGTTITPDEEIIAYVNALHLTVGLDVDGSGGAPVGSQDGVYIYRYLLKVWSGMGTIVPAGHAASESNVNTYIDIYINVKECPDGIGPVAGHVEVVNSTTLKVWFNESLRDIGGNLANNADLATVTFDVFDGVTTPAVANENNISSITFDDVDSRVIKIVFSTPLFAGLLEDEIIQLIFENLPFKDLNGNTPAITNNTVVHIQP